MSTYKAYINEDWKSSGFAQLFLIRENQHESADFCMLFVDTFCLGVVEAFSEFDLPVEAATVGLEECLPEEGRVMIAPEAAKKLVQGAVAYAEKLGFNPPASYKEARRVFSAVDEKACQETFDYGRNGRPCYIPEEDEDPKKIERVLRVLTARLGADGFEYVSESEAGEDEGSDEEEVLSLRNDLHQWLEANGEGGAMLHVLAGAMGALLVVPGGASPSTLVPLLWPKKEPAALKTLQPLLQAYWNYLSSSYEAFAADPQRGNNNVLVDIYADDLETFDPEPTMGMLMACAAWAGGFQKVVDSTPKLWGNVRQRPELKPHFEMIKIWSGLPDEKAHQKMKALQRHGQITLGSSVGILVANLRNPGGGKN